MSLNEEKKIEIFTTMKTIRKFEERVEGLYLDGLLPGLVHLYIGQEAVAAGACFAINSDDYIVSTHRGHGHLIAKGGQLDKMFAEIFGKKTGYCRGKGGSMHIADINLGILGANGIVGAGLNIAAGAALSAQLLGSNKVAVCFFGDGATNRGTFHEALNLSSLWNLPAIFVCENNLYGQGTAYSRQTKVDKISDRAAAYNMAGLTVDGNDVFAVYDAVLNAANKARNNKGPTLIECNTYRWKGHFIGDNGMSYRDQEEVDRWKKKCPILKMQKMLLKEGTLTERAIEEIDAYVNNKVTQAIEYAKSSPEPDPNEVFENIYTTHNEGCMI